LTTSFVSGQFVLFCIYFLVTAALELFPLYLDHFVFYWSFFLIFSSELLACVAGVDGWVVPFSRGSLVHLLAALLDFSVLFFEVST
jgi:hypothetical protein